MTNLTSTEKLLKYLDYPFSIEPSETGYKNNFYQTEQQYLGYEKDGLAAFENQLHELQKLSLAELGSIKKNTLYYQTLYEIIRTVNHQIERLNSFIKSKAETIHSVSEKAKEGNEVITKLLTFHQSDWTPQFAHAQLEVGQEYLKTLLSSGFEKGTPFTELILHVNESSEPLPLRMNKKELAVLFLLLMDARMILDADKAEIAKFIDANFKLFDKSSNNYVPISKMSVDLSRLKGEELKIAKEELLGKFEKE